MRLDRRWGPLGVVPIKLAVFLPAAVLDLGGLLSNRSGTTPMEASVAAVAMSALVAIMAVFIFFPNAASHYLRRTRKDGGCVSWLVHPFVGEVTLWACVLATEIGFSRLAAEAVTRWATRDGHGFASGMGTSPDRSRLGSSLDTGASEVLGSNRSAAFANDDESLPSLLFPLLNWVAVGFLSPLMSCELYCVGVGVDSHDSLVGGFGPVAWIHALSRVATATWLCFFTTAATSSTGGHVIATSSTGGLLSSTDSKALRTLATMSVVKTCVASFMAHASWCRRRAQYTDSSTMRGFLAYLSHECRVPLQVVLAGLEVLSGGGGGAREASPSGSLEDCDSDTGASGGPVTRSRGKGGNRGVGHRVGRGAGDECHVDTHYLGGPEGYATHVRAMQMAARSIHDVLDDTLDLHKYVLTGKISMTPRRFDFIRAAWETVEEARVAEIGARHGTHVGAHGTHGGGLPLLDLSFEASPEAEAELRWVRETLRAREFGDEQRLRQVLMNLVSNGIRHTPAGGAVRVTVASAKAVRIEDDTSASSRGRSHRRSSHRSSNDSNGDDDSNSPTSDGRGPPNGGTRRRRKSRHSHADDDETQDTHVGLVTLSVEVTDTGAGILARDKRYIFTPYGRGEGGGQGSLNGADGGIGLALSQLIVGQHGGKIDISSEAGVGSTFSMEITLPLVRDPAIEDDSADGHGRTPISRAPHHRRHRPTDHKPPIHNGGHPGSAPIHPRMPQERPPPSAIFASALYSAPGGDDADVADLRSDIARREARCRDGSDRAPRINMRRQSWEGVRTPRPSRTSPSTSDEADDARTDDARLTRDARNTIYEGRVTAPPTHPLGGLGVARVAPSAMQVDRPRRVLLVDDDRLVRMVLAALLRRMDAVCVTASDGAEAVDKCASGEFDLVIMDLRMPVMDGLEATRRIREIDADVPIVGLTANTMPEDTARFMRSGANEVVYKPISADNVEKLLSRYSDYSSNSPTNSYDDGVPAAVHRGVYDTM